MLAAAVLTIAAAAEHARGLRPSDQIPLTRASAVISSRRASG
jgi:hypothetical protein